MIAHTVLYLMAGAAAIVGGALLGALDILPERPTAAQRVRKAVGLTILALGLYVVVGTLALNGVLLPAAVGPGL